MTETQIRSKSEPETPSVFRSQALPKPNQLKAIVSAVANWAWSLTDAIPPYYTCEGELAAKKITADGESVIRINGAWLMVDEATYGMLSVGDHLRVRYTRRARSISIDKLVDKPHA